jgi:hypothetical protein
MAKGDTFFLRTSVLMAAGATAYASDDIDVSAYTDPSRGRCLVIDRSFITFSGDAGSPLIEADINASAASRGLVAQASSEKQTGPVLMSNNSLFAQVNLYAATDGTSFTMMQQENPLNPGEFTGGFIVPTDGIHCGVDVGQDWAGGIEVGFLFEVHTEKLSLQRIQELLVSLTAN